MAKNYHISSWDSTWQLCPDKLPFVFYRVTGLIIVAPIFFFGTKFSLQFRFPASCDEHRIFGIERSDKASMLIAYGSRLLKHFYRHNLLAGEVLVIVLVDEDKEDDKPRFTPFHFMDFHFVRREVLLLLLCNNRLQILVTMNSCWNFCGVQGNNSAQALEVQWAKKNGSSICFRISSPCIEISRRVPTRQCP